eukprot:scaffold3757_cov69-Skeletonema_marinoi.AAC.1
MAVAGSRRPSQKVRLLVTSPPSRPMPTQHTHYPQHRYCRAEDIILIILIVSVRAAADPGPFILYIY